MADAKNYSGSCHCGAVAYTVEVDPSQALKCNCTICTKLGAVWAFAPKTKFKLTSGETRQGDYQFGKKSLHHHFCTACGVASGSFSFSLYSARTFSTPLVISSYFFASNRSLR